MMPPPNAELTPSPLQIHQANLVPADHEAEPSLLFDQPDPTAKKRKGKGKEKAQSPQRFKHLPLPHRNVCIYFLSTYLRKPHYRPRWQDLANTNVPLQLWLRRRKPKMQWTNPIMHCLLPLLQLSNFRENH